MTCTVYQNSIECFVIGLLLKMYGEKLSARVTIGLQRASKIIYKFRPEDRQSLQKDMICEIDRCTGKLAVLQ